MQNGNQKVSATLRRRVSRYSDHSGSKRVGARLKQRRRRRQQQQRPKKKKNWFYDQNNSSARASRFLVHFFHVHCTTATWNLPMRRFMEDVDILRQFSLLYLNMAKAVKNSTPGKVAYIWRIERFQIDATKFLKGRKFIFLGMFSPPSS